MRKLLVCFLTAAMVLGLCACGGDKTKRPPLQLDTSGREVRYTFCGQEGETLTLSAEGVGAVLSAVQDQNADYFKILEHIIILRFHFALLFFNAAESTDTAAFFITNYIIIL